MVVQAVFAEWSGIRRGLWAILSWIVYQGAWFLGVWGAGVGFFWLGPVAVMALVGVHVWQSGRKHRLVSLAVLGATGTAVDSLQSFFQVLSFDGSPASWLCPLWITSMWVHLGLMLLGPMGFLSGRWVWAAAFGAIGGPMAYAAGVGLGAAEFGHSSWVSTLALGIVWTFAFPLAVRIMLPRSEA